MCWYCGTPVTDEEPLGRSLRCPDCGRDMRACKNCRFYLAGSRGDCAESRAGTEPDKERGNFCDWFSLNPRFREATAGEQKARSAAEKARSAFNDLFSLP
jgi:hypothetical protein